ncbi:MAG: chemotaxis protein CheX [Turneriella sp.]
MISIENSLRETTQIIAGVDLHCLLVNSPEDLPALSNLAHFVGVKFSGLKNGTLTLAVPGDSAFDLAHRILSTATGSEFAAENITVDLINNTLGELANMTAGHYLRKNGLAAASELFAPQLLNQSAVEAEISGGTGLILCEYRAHRFEAIFAVA